ncbi:MAG: glycosyltransferase family 2 protein [Bacteroidales bacterium]|nr:glycosyltransferase family 2 protein [Bacteroidales bacterium]
MSSIPSLLVIVPCYNEEAVLTYTNTQLTATLRTMYSQGQVTHARILYVDDGSTDTTWTLIEHLSTQYAEVMGLKLARNVGHQQALWAGLEWAAASDFDTCISIDADLQDDLAAIPQMVNHFANGYDIVLGVRSERHSDTAFKRHTAQGFYRAMGAMGAEVTYNHADFRLLSQRACQALVSHPERNLFIRGLVMRLGFPTAHVYYQRQERTAGKSKYPLRHMISFALDGMTSFSVKPLRLITLLGLCFILISVVAIVYGLYAWGTRHAIPGWTSLMVSMWFIGGALLMAIGVIGEYVGKIYQEVKRRPRYFIEKTANMTPLDKEMD